MLLRSKPEYRFFLGAGELIICIILLYRYRILEFVFYDVSDIAVGAKGSFMSRATPKLSFFLRKYMYQPKATGRTSTQR